jgi:hypothetical protein
MLVFLRNEHSFVNNNLKINVKNAQKVYKFKPVILIIDFYFKRVEM